MLHLLQLLLLVIMSATNSSDSSNSSHSTREVATLAGGCFWCIEAAFDRVPGVTNTTVGYTGGTVQDPTYEQVSSGATGHVEATIVEYDPTKVTYRQIVDEFWKNIDPTQADGQFADRGSQYETAIFYHSDEQRAVAEESKRALEQSGKFKTPIVTKILPAGDFYVAEESHQNYHEKNTIHYNLYKLGSGRAGFIKKTWGKE